jgi:hypothetical protein
MVQVECPQCQQTRELKHTPKKPVLCPRCASKANADRGWENRRRRCENVFPFRSKSEPRSDCELASRLNKLLAGQR